jgi:hypothetical protein
MVAVVVVSGLNVKLCNVQAAFTVVVCTILVAELAETATGVPPPKVA